MNPEFAQWNRVLLYYCDGASFSGDRADPVEVGGTQIFFRGRRVLDALLDELLAPAFGLAAAEEVLRGHGRSSHSDAAQYTL